MPANTARSGRSGLALARVRRVLGASQIKSASALAMSCHSLAGLWAATSPPITTVAPASRGSSPTLNRPLSRHMGAAANIRVSPSNAPVCRAKAAAQLRSAAAVCTTTLGSPVLPLVRISSCPSPVPPASPTSGSQPKTPSVSIRVTGMISAKASAAASDCQRDSTASRAPVRPAHNRASASVAWADNGAQARPRSRQASRKQSASRLFGNRWITASPRERPRPLSHIPIRTTRLARAS